MPVLDTLLDHAAMLERWTICTVDDVPDADFGAQPGGLVNHPAWVLGHLVYAMDNVSRRLGVTIERDDAWYAPFVTRSEPSDDRAAYPSKDDLVSSFQDASSTLRTAIRARGEAAFDEPAGNPMIEDVFPTLGRWITHVLLIEGPFHTGQLSAWRKAMDLPSVFASEDNLRRMKGDT